MSYQDYLGLGETLLIVDDERVILKTTQALLTDLNYRVLTAQSASEALKLLENRREAIDLVVADADMRGLDGIALSVMLREREPATRVIVLSGSPSRLIQSGPGDHTDHASAPRQTLLHASRPAWSRNGGFSPICAVAFRRYTEARGYTAIYLEATNFFSQTGSPASHMENPPSRRTIVCLDCAAV